MKLKEKVDFLINKLEEIYPTLEIPLDHKDPYTLLIAVLMSAQSTDKKVNQITPILFKNADNPYDMIKLSIEEIRSIIKPVGLSPTKSKGIWNLSKILIDKYECPQGMPVDQKPEKQQHLLFYVLQREVLLTYLYPLGLFHHICQSKF